VAISRIGALYRWCIGGQFGKAPLCTISLNEAPKIGEKAVNQSGNSSRRQTNSKAGFAVRCVKEGVINRNSE
jgi:hypothetical protein